MKRRSFLLSTLTGMVAGGFGARLFGQVAGEKNTAGAHNYVPPFPQNALARQMPLLTEAEAASGGYPFGDGGQQWTGLAQCRTKPNILAAVEDVGGLWISLDHGRNWLLPPRTGLRSFLNNGVQIDPLNPRRIFIIAQDSFLHLSGKGGLYATFDGGNSFTRKFSFKIGARLAHSPIAYARSSEDEKRGFATRWYSCIPSETENNLPLLVSDDGGVDWQQVRSLSRQEYGNPGLIVVDPIDMNKVYMGSAAGLFLITEASKPGSTITPLSGTNGLPAGHAAALFVSDNARTMICGVRRKGIYHSVDGGKSWSLQHEDKELEHLFVNPWNPNRLTITCGEKTPYPKFSTDGGQTCRPAISVEKRPGYTGDVRLVYGLNHAAYHPNAGELFFVGRQTNIGSAQSAYRSSDNGATLRLSLAGFSGCQHSNWCAPMMFDFENEKRFVLGMVDFKVWLTHTGGRWFEELAFRTGALGLKHSTVNGIALHPQKNRIVCAVGKANSGVLLLYDLGHWSRPLGGENRRYQFIGYDRDNPDYWFANRYRSTDGGLTWSVMGGLGVNDGVRGMTLAAPGLKAGQAIFTLDVDATTQVVKRSLDRGDTWQIVLNAPYKLFNIPGTKAAVFCAHPKDKDILFTIGPKKHMIRQWNLAAGSPGNPPGTDYNIFGSGEPPVDFLAQQIAIDCRFPGHLYVLNSHHGTGYKLLRTTHGGAGAWENLTPLITDGQCGGLEISPVSGNVLVAGSNGMRMLKAAYNDPKDLLGNLLLPNNLVSGDYMAGA